MKKNYLFSFVLALLLISTILVSYADDSVATTPQPETTVEETTNAEDAAKAQDTDTTPEKKEPYGVVSEYEKNLALLDATKNSTNASNQPAASGQEQGKAKKLNAVKSFIKSKNNTLSDATITKVAQAALAANEKHQLELSLILAVMWKESTFDPTAANAICHGVMQIHKNTASGFGYKIKDLYDPYKSADLGTRILKGHIRNYNNTIIGLTAYNQGTGNVNRGNYNTRYANNVLQKKQVIDSYLNKAMA